MSRISITKSTEMESLLGCCCSLVVLFYIQRISCQPEKSILHGGQSRSLSAEKGKEYKKRKSGGTTPLPPSPHAACTEEIKYRQNTGRIRCSVKFKLFVKDIERYVILISIPLCYAVGLPKVRSLPPLRNG